MRVQDAFPFAPDRDRLAAIAWQAASLASRAVRETQAMLRNVYDFMRSAAFRKRTAFRRLFLDRDGNPNRDAATVLTHMARFCNAHVTTARRAPGATSFDPIAMAKAEGRREVWIEFQKHLGVSDAAILRLHEQELSYE